MDEARLCATFSALTAEDGKGHSPFRWQVRLLRRMLKPDLPETVDIPTGLGKTAVMALWLIALGERATLPRRLVYVVDRRAVVDQATRFAERLRSNMSAELTARLGLAAEERLPISTLRGQFTDNRDWMEDPSKPAIVVGTIDMIGSRLLFEGYGVSRRMRPYHAGLLGVDALVLLDEAHLCPPFEALLRQVASSGGGRLGPTDPDTSTPPLRLMSLSATGRPAVTEESAGYPLQLEAEDHDDAEVRRRLLAQKRLSVTELDVGTNLAERLAERAVEVGCAEPVSRVLIYCDRRRDAVEVKQRIDKECRKRHETGELAPRHASELLVGERRVRERGDVEGWLDEQGFLGAGQERPSAPIFLIATSAGEVGIDLNADHMVCDLVAYERMVQRLGRVNRRGGADRRAKIDVLALPPELKGRAPKDASERVADDHRRWLAALLSLPVGEDGRRDASPAAIIALKRAHPSRVRGATTRAPLYPELTRPLLDAWSMTSLGHHDGRPEVAPWLRGWKKDDEPQTSVVWRKYLPCVRTGEDTTLSPSTVAEFFRVAPLHATERLEATTSRAFEWMLKRAAQAAKRAQGHDCEIGNDEIVVSAIDHAGEHRAHLSLAELSRLAAPAKYLGKSELRPRDRTKREWRDRHLPGATLVVDSRLCGLRNGMLDEKCEVAPQTADGDENWRDWRDPVVEGSRPLIGFLVQRLHGGGGDEGLTLPDRRDWLHVRTFDTSFDAAGVASTGLAVFKRPDEPSDEESRSVLAAPQSLRAHAEQVAEHASALARRLGLEQNEAQALVSAARLHDDGKAAERWQNAMNARRDGRPYAKTSGGGNPRLLEGYRHEFGSLLKAERTDLPNETRDLILHLIAAHHGNARPTLSPRGCEEGPPSVLESKAGDAALRFVRLQNRYGPWGLAWREALLRAADQSASKAWSNRHGDRSG